jgi:uncharacterized protein (TIGR02611 family)
MALARRVVIGMAGSCVVLLGLVLVPLPGPGWPIVFLGFVVLSSVFAWAERLRRGIEARAGDALRWSAAAPRFARTTMRVATVASLVVPLWLLAARM